MKNKKRLVDEIPKIGVFICHCGINIGGIIDIPKIVTYTKTLPGVDYVESNLYTCSSDGIRSIKEAIDKHGLNRVVVASCTPRTHESLFRETCEEAGLNKYLFEMANIREHCSWVHMEESEEATKKAKGIVRMAIAKAWSLRSQEETKVEVTPSSLIIGAGISGIQAALNLARCGFKVYLIDKEPTIGGMLRNLYKLYPTGQYASEILNSANKVVKAHNNIDLYTSTIVEDVKGYIGNYEVTVLKNGKERIKINVGTIIVATGAEEYKPTGMFCYGEHNSVITQLELERLLKEGFLQKVNKVAMIQCVGAMEEEGGREYCSRICCATALKNALLIKKENPKADIYILYRDLQTYGKEYEKYYIRAQEQNVKFINYLQERRPTVKPESGDKLTVNVFHTLIGKDIAIDCDLVVLSTPLIQHESGEFLSPLLKIPLGSDKFFLEAHTKLRPVDFATDGIYLCGTAHGPKALDESIIQAYAAASSAAIPMSKGHVQSEAITAVVDEDLCRGCGKCQEVCEYNAINMDRKVLDVEPFILAPMILAKVNEVVCKGCGSCASACPTGAITMKHFTDKQILAQIKAAYGGLSHDS
jgi:heterodisulfide reductase subunit A